MRIAWVRIAVVLPITWTVAAARDLLPHHAGFRTVPVFTEGDVVIFGHTPTNLCGKGCQNQTDDAHADRVFGPRNRKITAISIEGVSDNKTGDTGRYNAAEDYAEHNTFPPSVASLNKF